MRKRFYVTAVALGMGIFLLAGCGNNASDKDVPVSGTEAGKGGSAANFDYNVSDYVTLGEYKNLKVRYPVPSVSEEDVEIEVEYLLEENTKYNEISDRAAQNGDYINMDFAGTIDGKEFEGGSAEGFELTLGEEEFIEEFEKNLIGKNPKEEFTFQMTFPEDYDDTVGGKVAEFKVTINTISEVVVPEYNDAFVKEVTDYDTVKEYEEALMEELMTSAMEDAKAMAGDDVLLTAIANAKIDGYPQDLFDECYNSRIQEYQEYADALGMELSEFIGEESELNDEVTDWVNEILVAQAISEKEGLGKINDAFSEDAEAAAVEYGYESLNDFLEDYGEVYVRVNLLRDKIVDFLYENAEVEEVSEEEYYSEDVEGEEDSYEEGVEELEELSATESLIEDSTE